MNYFKSLLLFSAIILLFEFGWILVKSIFAILTSLFKNSEKGIEIMVLMVLEKLLYCFCIIGVTVLAIHYCRQTNPESSFTVLSILIPLLYFIVFFADKKRTESANIPPELLYNENFSKTSSYILYIESVSILAFIPLVFFPFLVDNVVTRNIFDGIFYLFSMKYGIWIGIVGLFVLAGTLYKSIEIAFYLVRNYKDI